MRILVAPVSGGTFPIQVNYIQKAVEASGTHDITFASSGGNIAMYLLILSGYDTTRLKEIIMKLRPSVFSTSWWRKPFSYLLPSWLCAPLKGSLYDRGTGLQEFFQELPENSPEIWTGTYNMSRKKVCFFCNTTPGKSKLDITRFNPAMVNSLDLRFLSGDKNKIARATYASAAIPLLIPPVKIGLESYVDGGVGYSSPFTALKWCLPEGNLHIDYITGMDIEAGDCLSAYRNIVKDGVSTLVEVLESLLIQDRLAGISYISKYGSIIFEEGECTSERLGIIEARRKQCSASFLELYPREKVEISITSFTPEDIIRAIEKGNELMSYRFWYVFE